MKKALKIIAIAIIIFALIGPFLLFIEQVVTNEDPVDETPTYTAEGTVSLGDIKMNEHELQFEVYLARSDKTLDEKAFEKRFISEGTMRLTSDLPLELQPKLMYVTDKEDSFERMCDRPRFPHSCPVELENFGEEMEKEFLIKVAFEDGGYFEAPITVKRLEALEKVEILEPTSLPEQGSMMSMSFKGTGADRYRVAVRLCEEYQNDGINPCLNGEDYAIARSNGKLEVEYNHGAFLAPEMEVKGGVVHLSSMLPMNFAESVEYEVKTEKEVTKDSINYSLENYSRKVFKVE